MTNPQSAALFVGADGKVWWQEAEGAWHVIPVMDHNERSGFRERYFQADAAVTSHKRTSPMQRVYIERPEQEYRATWRAE